MTCELLHFPLVLINRLNKTKIVSEYDQENTTITKCRQTHGTARKSHATINHEAPGRQTEQSNQLSLPHQDDCKTRMDIKYRITKYRTITDSSNGSNNKKQVNNKSAVFLYCRFSRFLKDPFFPDKLSNSNGL